MVAKADQTLHVGDRVLVEWGLEEVEGIIEDTYNSGSGPRIRVRVIVAGPQDEELDHFSFVVPSSAVRPVED